MHANLKDPDALGQDQLIAGVKVGVVVEVGTLLAPTLERVPWGVGLRLHCSPAVLLRGPAVLLL